MVMMMAKTRGEGEVSKPNIALTDIQQVKKDSFLFFKVTTINAHYSLWKKKKSKKKKCLETSFSAPSQFVPNHSRESFQKKFLSQEKDISCCDKLGLLKKPFPLLCLFCTRRRRRRKTTGFFFCKWSSSFGSLVVRLLFSCREMSFSIEDEGEKTVKEYFLLNSKVCRMCEKVMLNNRNNKKMRLWHAVRKLTQGL